VSLQPEIYYVTICKMFYDNSSCSVVDIMFNTVVKPLYEVIIHSECCGGFYLPTLVRNKFAQ
jgi:hypothetical protein